MNALDQHLEFMVHAREKLGMGSIPDGYLYSCFEAFILDRGAPPEVNEPMPREWVTRIEHVIEGWGLKFPIKQCYANAQTFVFAADSDDFVYVEGYVQRLIPAVHGWVEVAGRWLFDPTLRFLGDKTIEGRNVAWGQWPEDDREYRGIRFPDRRGLMKYVDDQEAHCSIIDDWQNKFPLLKDPDYESKPSKSMDASGDDLPVKSSG